MKPQPSPPNPPTFHGHPIRVIEWSFVWKPFLGDPPVLTIEADTSRIGQYRILVNGQAKARILISGSFDKDQVPEVIEILKQYIVVADTAMASMPQPVIVTP